MSIPEVTPIKDKAAKLICVAPVYREVQTIGKK
jgi:hypothetical protein